MKILLLGKNGQLGYELQRALLSLGQVIALDRQEGGDLSNLEGLASTVRCLAPDIVVNAAAYTAVDKAESESEQARLINTQAVECLAKEASALDAWFVHYSTDYVFDGSGDTPWKESDANFPLNCYGQSKLAGERAIQMLGGKYLIFRSSWIYGRQGNNFIKTILRLAEEREEIQVVCDQIGVPSAADFLADMTAHALRTALNQPKLSGLYHLVPQGEVSWYDYAHFIIETLKTRGVKLKVKKIRPILSGDYNALAKRPLNSRLDTSKFSETFALYLAHWELGVSRLLNDILGLKQ